MSIVFAGALGALAPSVAHAQAAPPPSTPDEPDAVILKHGGVIKGKVTEILPGDHVTVSMTSGQNAIVRWDEVGSIARGGVLIKTPEAPAPQPAPTTVAPAPAPAPQPQKYFYGPAKMPYDDDDPIPPGYHVESHKKLGLLITGAILTGIGTLGIVAYDLQNHVTGDERVAFDLVWGAIWLGPGVPLLLVGLLSNSKQLVRDDVGALHLKLPGADKPTPIFLGIDPHKDHPGLKLGFTF